MTRIIAGTWRGHPLPRLRSGPVRPTTDRARTVLFDTLRDVRGLQVLDLYSGTGALGLESLSRGAEHVISVDRDAKYIRAQQEWARQHEANHTAYTGDVARILGRLEDSFDLIFADPPYAEGIPEPVLRSVEARSHSGTLFVYESARDDAELETEFFQLWKEKVVAQTKIRIYKAH